MTGQILFVLDDIQRADLDATVGAFTPTMRLGLSASVDDAQGGLETFAFVDLARSTAPPIGNIPEPATWLLAGAGLVLARFARRTS